MHYSFVPSNLLSVEMKCAMNFGVSFEGSLFCFNFAFDCLIRGSANRTSFALVYVLADVSQLSWNLTHFDLFCVLFSFFFLFWQTSHNSFFALSLHSSLSAAAAASGVTLAEFLLLRSPNNPACNFIHRTGVSFALSSAIVATCSFVTSSAFGRHCFAAFLRYNFFFLLLLCSFFHHQVACVRKIGDLEQFYFRIVNRYLHLDDTYKSLLRLWFG